MKATGLLGFAFGAAACLVSESARAEGELRGDWNVNKATQEEWDGGYDLKAQRRSGFAAGLSFGLGMTAASGYPNEVEKLDKEQYRSSTGVAFGSVSTIWVGGAIRDWFVFGLGIYGMGGEKDELEVRASGFMVHVETFPLWSLGGRFRDLSLYTNLGTGGLTIEGGPEKADGGLMSVLSLGSSFELLRLKHFALGPSIDGLYTYSQYAKGGGVYFGVRAAIYGGP